MIDYVAILVAKYAGSEWTLEGNDYEGLTWLSATNKPSKQELDAHWQTVMTELEVAKIAQSQKRVLLLEKLGITEDELRTLLQ